MGLEVLFGHLLPELQWDSSNHLLPSADQQAWQGPARCLCSPVHRCCRAVPSCSHPLGAAAWSCGTQTCP